MSKGSGQETGMFCNHCGAKFDGEPQFCRACGKPVTGMPAATAAPAPAGRLQRHLRLLAIFWLVFAALRLLKGGASLAGAGMARHLGERFFGDFGWGWPIQDILPPILAFSGAWLLLTAIAALVAGIGLLDRRPWARVAALVVAFLSLLNPPLGTALGIYTIWVLLPSQAEQEYRQISAGGMASR